MELLIQAHLTRESAALSPALMSDFRRMLELAPRLLEELLKVIYGLLHAEQSDFGFFVSNFVKCFALLKICEACHE